MRLIDVAEPQVGPTVQGHLGPMVQGYLGLTVQGYLGPMVQGYLTDKKHHPPGTWYCFL